MIQKLAKKTGAFLVAHGLPAENEDIYRYGMECLLNLSISFNSVGDYILPALHSGTSGLDDQFYGSAKSAWRLSCKFALEMYSGNCRVVFAVFTEQKNMVCRKSNACLFSCTPDSFFHCCD